MKKTTVALQESAHQSALRTGLSDHFPGFLPATQTILSLGLLSLGFIPASQADEHSDDLPDTTIIANRTTTPIDQAGSSVSVLDVGLLQQQGIYNLDDALKFVPGVTADSVGGQRGSTSDLYIRGLRTTHTHIVVDGMRISDTNSGFILGKQFLGSNNLGGLSRIEILRGPQGALYGGDSIGGVLGLYSVKGTGDHQGHLRLEGGSFNSWNSSLGFQGSDNGFSYSLTLGQERTDNDLDHNTFESFSYALRLDYDINDQLSIGLTLRGADSSYEGPRTGIFYAGPDDTDFLNNLTTLFVKYQLNELWNSKLTLGLYDQESSFVSRAANPPFGNPGDPWYNPGSQPPTISYTNEEELTKYAVYWDNTLTWNEQHTTVAGLVYEKSDYLFTDSFASYDNRTRKQQGFYVNHLWNVTEQFHVSGGLRWEDYSDTGSNGFNDDVVTWRLAGAYTIESSNTTIRSSVGHGFRIPNASELNGNPGFGIAPNPNLDPVESLGWDLGIEQSFCDGQHTLGVTYFGNRLDNAIINNRTQYINVAGISETSGIEAFAETRLLDDRLKVKVSYTWLDRALVDIPENTIGLRIQGQITDQWEAGVTASYLDNRSYGGNNLSSYTLVNLYSNYTINENVALNLRIENVFDESYIHFNDASSTYPGRGQGFFGGITVKW